MSLQIELQAKLCADKYGKTYDQKQDIEGRCLEAAWKAETKIREDENPKAYISIIMRNVALDYIRDTTKTLEVPFTDCASILDTIAPTKDEVESRIIDTVFKYNSEFFLKLEAEDQELLKAIMENESYKDIAARLGVKPNTIAVRFSRIRKKYRNLMIP